MRLDARRGMPGGIVAPFHARRLLPGLFLATVLLVAGCGRTGEAVVPQSVTRDSTCALDGMVLMDYPGPKAQIHYDQGGTDFFCDTLDMMAMVLGPEQKKHIVAMFTEDMAKADWVHPEGHWINARTAFYVAGSSRMGSMGPTLASFGTEGDAKAFAAKYGGKVLRFAEITLEMVTQRGGAAHDEQM